MSTLASAIQLLDSVHDALADHETPCRVTRSPDGSTMTVATESGDRITVTAGNDGKLSIVHDGWDIAIAGNYGQLDASVVTGYIEFTALQGDIEPCIMWTHDLRAA